MVESIDDFITKSQKQGAKKIINKKETSEVFYAIITRSATKYFWFMAKQKISK